MHYTFINGLCTLQSIPTSVIPQSQSSLQRKMHRKELRFVQRCISRWRSFFHYFTPLKDFSSLYFERSIQSVPSGTLLSKATKKKKKKWNKEREREEGEEEEEKEMHVLILFHAMGERRRKIVLLTLPVEDNFQDTKQPQSSFYGSNINAKFSRLGVENGKENRDWGVRDLHSFARFYRPLCPVFKDCPVASVNKDVQYGKFPAR